MKVKVFAFIAAALCTLSAWAFNEVDFVGAWQSKEVVIPSEDGMRLGLTDYLEFTKDKKASMEETMKMTLELDRDIMAEIYIYTTGQGTYCLDGDSLRVEIDPATVEFRAPAEEINIRGDIDMFQSNQFRDIMAQQVLPAMLTQAMEQINAEGISMALCVKEFDKKKFVAYDDDNTKITFNSKKPKKKK